ncbi:MAG: TlyA family RNA methyltransferase [Pseudanabaenaceae cyanobacterium SKYGB_i_bin29]|nr:TlyA family RNA methyltransferase [Pseudanabaenaceae cyanobacterium SKYG29]MDW8420285.1 TlyA family RNA methyltransferase [Pseudanabaenaceae cyanobacterium SKYGB_i_bin29]
MKERLDVLLVKRGLAASREQAQRVIRAGWVLIDEVVIDKPGTEITVDASIRLKEQYEYVSRGGEKLAGAIKTFGVRVTDRVCLDGGISTGGFTGYLLERGATRVYGIDVGYGQVAWSLRNDPRLVLRERTNLRYLTPEELYNPGDPIPDLAVVDLSFISLTKVLAALWQLLQPPREMLLLVKPQFEVGRDKVGKQGIVREQSLQLAAVEQVSQAAMTYGWQPQGILPAPITGKKGNQEYWLWLIQGVGIEPTCQRL